MFESKHWGWAGLLIAAFVGIFAFSFIMAPAPADGEESFAGSDSVVTGVLEEEHGVEPWFDPIFEPGSGEIESGLFAIQAGLGAGILGFALGNLRGRAVQRKEQVATAEDRG
ncbi:MAG: energy-coupling factor ABC transporter substrate-binding protein [Tessaracoccus sp.]